LALKFGRASATHETTESVKVKSFRGLGGRQTLRLQTLGLDISLLSLPPSTTQVTLKPPVRSAHMLVVRSADQTVLEAYTNASLLYQPIVYPDEGRGLVFIAYREIGEPGFTVFRCVVIEANGKVLASQAFTLAERFDQALFDIAPGTDGRPVLMIGGQNVVPAKSGVKLHAELSSTYHWVDGEFLLLE
jgi:hypothetical protein